jgi:hypothetical protein
MDFHHPPLVLIGIRFNGRYSIPGLLPSEEFLSFKGIDKSLRKDPPYLHDASPVRPGRRIVQCGFNRFYGEAEIRFENGHGLLPEIEIP